MNSFTFYSSTKIFFGQGMSDNISEYIRSYAPDKIFSKIFIVYGSERIKKSGLLDKVESALHEAAIEYMDFGGVKANPTLEHAYKGIELSKSFNSDLILAIGGGSVIDTAKAIAHGTANPQNDIWDFWIGQAVLSKSLPIACILTIPAAGSECSNSAVLTNTQTTQKRGLSTDLNRPLFSVLDPTLACTLPKYQIGCGITDIMMHTMDRYFNPMENEMSDAIAEALLRTVIKYGSVLIKDSHNYEAMSEIMWAGTLSHNDLTGLGGKKDFAPHQLGHELSACFDLSHGASLSTVWESWAKYVYTAKPSRFARFARNVWNISEVNDCTAAVAGIKATVDYFKSLGMPTCMSESVGIKDEAVIKKLTSGCSRNSSRTIGTFKTLNDNDIQEIYKMANH